MELDGSHISFERREKSVPQRYRHLLDLFSLFLVAYFFILSWLLPAEMGESLITPIGKYLPKIVVNKLLLPIFISFLWIFLISQEREHLTRALFIFDGFISRLSFFQKAFYGINILIAMLLFILPLASIGIAFVLVFYLPYLVACKVKRSKELAFFIFFIIFFLLGAVAFLSLPKLTILLAKGWLHKLFFIWIAPSSVSIIYDISLSIGAAGSIGSFIFFVYQGAHEYDQTIKIPEVKISTLEAGLGIVFSSLILYSSFFLSSVHTLLVLFFSALLFIYTLERFLRWLKGLERTRRNTLGQASFLLFFLLSLIGMGASNFVINFLKTFNLPIYPDIFKIGSMLSATAILVITFLFCYRKALLKKKRDDPVFKNVNFQ